MSNSYLNGIDTVSENLGQYGVLDQTFAFNPSLSSISVELESNSPIIFSEENSYSNIHGQNEWIGVSNSSNCVSCKFHLVEDNNIIEGLLLKANQIFGISHIGGSNYAFYEKSTNNSDCDTHLFPALPINESDETSNTRLSSSSDCQTANTVSMIIAYTPEFANTFSSTGRQDRINDFLSDVIRSVNQTYINSDLNVRVRLAFSYQTPNSEFGNKDDDFDSFINVATCKGLFCGGEKWREYDEIWNYRSEFNADVSILLVAARIGGRASRSLNMAIYGKEGANWNYGVAHEIGHMLDLEHNREEYSWFERIFLDGKDAYGYRGDTYKTVMSYGWQTREPLYSDYRYDFPDGNIAGNNRAKARNYAAGHLGRILKKSDPSSLTINQTLLGTETATFIATSDVTTQNFVTNSGSRVHIEAPNSITLEPGTHLQNGSTALIRIAGNPSELVTFFNEGISLATVISPTCSSPCVDLEIDGYRDDLTFEWFQDDDRTGCGNCQLTTELGTGGRKSVCFVNTEGNPSEQRTFRVVVTDLSRCTLGEIYLDGKLYCGTNFRVAEPESLSAEESLNVKNESISTFSVYPNPSKNKQFKLRINNDEFVDYEISVRNLSGVRIYTTTITDPKRFPLKINMSNQPSGVYIIDYCTNTKECFSHKVIIK